ncbi:unnamed protein product [Lymnaea stagnalis]|uniref:CUB domain-containing protein n=1 Tax=Lymnaea stagnalis TaxID=6523 RepID=A0AAV2H3D8_LYMST
MVWSQEGKKMFCDNEILWVFFLLFLGTTSLTADSQKGNANICGVDVCAMNKEGLRCPTGSNIHILNVVCSSAVGGCSRSTYDALFPCDGSRHCSASSLKGLLAHICEDPGVTTRGVVVEYSCLPEAWFESKCSWTNFRQLDDDYGILRSPELDFNDDSIKNVCKWNITPRGDQRIKITVLIMGTKNGLPDCEVVLNISFVDCSSKRIKTSTNCKLWRSRDQHLTSCGAVNIESRQLHGVGALGKFVISYQRYKTGDSPELPLGLPCDVSSAGSVTNVPLPSRITQRPSVKLSPAIHNYGPGDGMFDSRDNSYSHVLCKPPPRDRPRSCDESSSLSKFIKFIALKPSCLSLPITGTFDSHRFFCYHRLSKNGGSSGSSSEKTALWHQQDETPLDTFQTNSMAEGSGSLTSETNYPYTVASESDKVVATVHHDAISENEEFNHRLSSGSGISTFLSDKRDNDFRDLINTFQTGSFAVYDDVSTTNTADADFYQMPAHEIYEMSEKDDSSNIYEVIDRDHQNNASNKNRKVLPNSHSSVPNHDIGANDSKPFVDHTTDDCHYSVNNDEYAVVQKSRKPVQEAGLSGHYEPLFDNGEVVDFRPTSGPYEKMRNSNREPSTRWSKGGERWMDDY